MTTNKEFKKQLNKQLKSRDDSDLAGRSESSELVEINIIEVPIYETFYKWNQEAINYYNQRMQQWQKENTALLNQGKPGKQRPSIITVWERKPNAPNS
mgnify:CR=1 FL=1